MFFCVRKNEPTVEGGWYILCLAAYLNVVIIRTLRECAGCLLLIPFSWAAFIHRRKHREKVTEGLNVHELKT